MATNTPTSHAGNPAQDPDPHSYYPDTMQMVLYVPPSPPVMVLVPAPRPRPLPIPAFSSLRNPKLSDPKLGYSVYVDLMAHLSHLCKLQHELKWPRDWGRASFGRALADMTGEKVLWAEMQIVSRRVRRVEGEGGKRAFSARIVAWDFKASGNGLTGESLGQEDRSGWRVLAGPVGWTDHEEGPVGYGAWGENKAPDVKDVAELLKKVCEGKEVDGLVLWNAIVEVEDKRRTVLDKVSLSEAGLMRLRTRYIEAGMQGLGISDGGQLGPVGVDQDDCA